MQQSGLLDLLEPGDAVMADKGFDVRDELMLRGFTLNIPPIVRKNVQMTRADIVKPAR